MKYALINGGAVVNVIEAEAGFAATLTGYDAVIASNEAGIGWTWDGAQFAPPPAPPQADPPPPTQEELLRQSANEFLLGIVEGIK
ncbi:MAG: hypothetical protein LBI48_00705 [Burkholderiaceae bacterium]|jgi:hypothetical protein|nr:hypothetical protein [Burkholderiaceae bacterium]